MTKFLGRLANIGFKKESVRGTAEASATYWIPSVNLSFDDEIEQVIDESTVGVIEDAIESEITSKIAIGTMEGNIGVDTIGLLLLSVFGSVSTSGPTDSAYIHTYTVGQDAQHDALSIFINEANQDWKHALGMISDFSLDIVLGSYAKFSAGFRAKAGETATNTVSISEETRFLPQHGVFKVAATQSGLGAAGASDIRQVTLNIDKSLEEDRKIGSTDPADILNGQFMVDGSLEFVYDADTLKDTMLADTQQALRISLINTGVTIGASTNPTIQIDLYKVKFTNFKRNFDNGSIVVATVDFKALYSLADSKMLDLVLTNDVVSY